MHLICRLVVLVNAIQHQTRPNHHWATFGELAFWQKGHCIDFEMTISVATIVEGSGPIVTYNIEVKRTTANVVTMACGLDHELIGRVAGKLKRDSAQHDTRTLVAH